MDMPSEAELVARLVVAMVLGGLIGFERELRDHPAGLRTHIAVAVGSALFVIAGAYGFDEFVTNGRTNVVIGVDRVASTVVTGIGFLGGGAILKHGATVKGLTTAGSLWVTAALGLAAGLGSYLVAVAATVITLVSLAALRFPERFIQRKLSVDRETVIIRLRQDADPSAVIGAVADLPGVTLRSLTVRKEDDALMIECAIRGARGEEVRGAVAPIAQRDDVVSLDIA